MGEKILKRNYLVLALILAVILGGVIFSEEIGNLTGFVVEENSSEIIEEEEDFFNETEEIDEYKNFFNERLENTYSSGVSMMLNLEEPLKKKELKNKIISDFKKKSDKGKIRVLVKDEGVNLTELNDPNKVKRKLSGHTSLELTEKEFERIVNSEEVELSSLALDYQFEFYLEESADLTGINFVREDLNLTGQGKKICIIDTGADSEKVGVSIRGYNVFDGTENIESNLDHGTWMARIIHEIAPDAEILMVKVFDESGVGYASDVLAGLEWCEEQNPDIISMSIGGGNFEGVCIDDPVAVKVRSFYEGGVLVVASAGNDGTSGLSSPACGKAVFSVGSSNKDEEISEFSNYFDNLDLLAPGENIQLVDSLGNSKQLSGTSVSAAIVSASSALILETREELHPYSLEKGLMGAGELVSEIPFLNLENYFKGEVVNNYSSEIYIFVGGEAGIFETDTTCLTMQQGYYCSSGYPLFTNPYSYGLGECEWECENANALCCQLIQEGGAWDQGLQFYWDLCQGYNAAGRGYNGATGVYAAICSSLIANGGACTYGDQCQSDYCVGGTCRQSCSGYDKVQCSTTTATYNGGSAGVCTGGDNTCDYNEVADSTTGGTGLLYSDCSDVGILRRCDNNAGTFAFNGACNSANDCTTSGTLTSTGATSCGSSGNLCDSAVGTMYTADGRCISNSCRTSGAVCLSGGNYYSSMYSCGDYNTCDKGRSGTASYSADGMICGGSCVGTTSSNCCSTGDCSGGQTCNPTTYQCETSCTGLGGSCNAGTDCCSNYCIEGTCRSSCSGYTTDQCSTTSTSWSSYGLCSNDASCRTGLMYGHSASVIYHNWNDYDNHIYTIDPTGDSCDVSVSGGTYSHDGMLVHSGGNYDSGHCHTGSVVRVDHINGNVFKANCDSTMGLCDTAISSSYTPFLANGRCASDGCRTSGGVCKLLGGHYILSDSICGAYNLLECDKSRTGTDPFSPDGITCGGSCVGSGSSNCCSNTDCGETQYCSTSTYTCTALPTCAKKSGTNSYTYQTSGEDDREECPASTTCNNQYQIATTDGFCSGSSYSCKAPAITAVATGSVCQNGISNLTSGSSTCGTGAQACWCANNWYQCDTVNDCNYDRTRVGFNSGGGCVYGSAYDSVYSFNQPNPTGFRCNVGSTTAYSSHTSIMDTNNCATGTCANQYQINTYTCGSGGTCSASQTPVASGSVCRDATSVATSASTNCGTGSQACWCADNWYQCDAVNDCHYDRTRVGFTSTGTCIYSGSYFSVHSTDQQNPGSNRCNVASTTAYSSYGSIMDTNACRSSAGACDAADYCSSGTCTDNKLTGKQTCGYCTSCDGVNNACQSIVMTECGLVGGTDKTFTVKTSTTELFKVDTDGNVWVAGEIYSSQGSFTPPANSYSIKNSAGTNLLYVAGAGDLYSRGTVSSGVGTISAGTSDFLIKSNIDSSYIFKVDNSGNIQSKGSVGYCCAA